MTPSCWRKPSQRVDRVAPKAQRSRFVGARRSVAYARLGQAGLRNVTEHAANLRRVANELESFEEDRVRDELELAVDRKEE